MVKVQMLHELTPCLALSAPLGRGPHPQSARWITNNIGRRAALVKGVFRARLFPQGVRRLSRPRIRKAAGSRRAAAPKRRAFRARSVPQGGRFSPRHRIRKAAGSCAQPPHKAAGFPCAARFARRPAFAAPPHPQGGGFSVCGPFRKRRPVFVALPFLQGGGFSSCGHHAGRLAWLRPLGAAPPFSPPPAPRRRYTRRFPTCRTGTPTARSRDKASGSACPRCGRRGNIGPVPRRSTSFSPPPLGPWGGASLSMPGRRKKRAGFAAARR